MKQFVFMYPIPEYINWEIKQGAYGWMFSNMKSRWKQIVNDNHERDIKEKLLKESQARFSLVYSRNLNKCIDARYRNNDFNINWVIFKNHQISDIVNVSKEDKILETDLDYKTHTIKRDDGTYPYPDNDFILDNIGLSSFLQIAGFHRWDCVDKLAKMAYERGTKVLVDEDLTEMFYMRFRDRNFRVDKYPTYDPRKMDGSMFEEFMNARKNRPWLWQDY